MPIELSCPRCTKMLSFGDEFAGQYAFCDQCQGRLWVPQDATSNPESTSTETGLPDNTLAQEDSTGTSENRPPPRLPKSPKNTTSQSPPIEEPLTRPTGIEVPPSSQERVPTASKEPPKIKSQQKATENVAKFIAADIAESRIEMGADGQLPELTLSTDVDSQQKMESKRTQNPWGLVLLICGSLIASTALLMFEDPSTKTHSDIEGMILRLKDKYIQEPDNQLVPYQKYLRDALLARSQGDAAKEQTYYRKVLHLLRAEHHKRDHDEKGLTGQLIESSDRSLRSDEDLEKQLSDILTELNKH